VLRLRIEDEATYEEIALRLGCSPAAARQQASRGMRRMSEHFQAAAP
jgi:DNA-directed RNA polymerase specialized sigma24 family protein